jgi:hypothetical protein
MKTKDTTKYRNKFESDVGEQLKGWQYEPRKYPYIIKRNYTPDFVKDDLLVECKGFFRSGDTKKYISIRDSLPQNELVFVLTNPNKKVRKGSKITMGEWCDKEGFKWFIKETLQELKSYGPTIK